MNVTRTYKRESIPAAIDKGILKVARKYCEESFSDFNQLIDNALAVYLQLVDADTSISGWEELYYNLPTFAKGRKLQLMIEREIFDPTLDIKAELRTSESSKMPLIKQKKKDWR